MIENNLNKNEIHYHSSGGSIWDNLFALFKKRKMTKDSLRILFIDDNRFPIVDNLKDAGYFVEWLKDVKRIDDSKILASHIIFVDYKGVGKNLSQSKEGIGICKMLKEIHKDSKYIVLYTGENIPNHLMPEIKSASDECMDKFSETADFINTIMSAVQKIRI